MTMKLKDYTDARLNDLTREFANQFRTVESDIRDLHREIAVKVSDRIRETNQIREMISERTHLFESVIRREEYDQKHEELSRRIGEIEKRLANLFGKAIIWAILGSILMVVLGAVVSHLVSIK